MSIENIITIVIGIAIAITILISIFISKSIFNFDIIFSCFLSSDTTGTNKESYPPVQFHNDGDHTNASTTTISNVETAIVVTPSDPVSDPLAEISVIAHTQTIHSPIKLPVAVLAAKVLNTPVKNYTKTRFLTSKKPSIHCGQTRSSLQALQTAKPSAAVVSRSTQKSQTKVTSKPVAAVVSRSTQTRDTTVTAKPVAAVVSRATQTRDTKVTAKPVAAVVSRTTQTSDTKVTAKPVNAVVSSSSQTSHTKVTAKPVVEGNHTKPKIRTSRKPAIPSAPRSTAVVHTNRTRVTAKPVATVVSRTTQTSAPRPTAADNQAKPVKKLHVIAGTANNNNKSVKKYFVSDGNHTKPEVFTSRKPSIPCAPKSTAVVSPFIQTNRSKVTLGGKQKLVKKPCLVYGTKKDTTNETKPKVLVSTPTTLTKVTPKGCIQRWHSTFILVQ